MNPNSRRIRGLALILGTIAAMPPRARAQTPAAEAPEILAAEAALVEFALTAPRQPPTIGPRSIEMQAADTLGAAVILRGTLAISDHWHWYTVAVTKDRSFRLGGFSAPELEAFAQHLRGADTSSLDPVAVSRLLARVADPEGAINTAFPNHSGQGVGADAVLAQWHRLRPSDWPADTITRRSDGRVLVRLTMLSERTRAMTPVWVPTLYSFLYDRRGALRTWARWEGEPFGLRQRQR